MISESRIEKSLHELFSGISFADSPAGLYEPLRYMIALGGKRVRPRLCLTVYALYRDRFSEGVLSAAGALEVFHSFTLIHDDMMDRADIRRGQPTVCRKWGDNTAILSGDVMCIDAYNRLSGLPASVLPAVLALFGSTAAQVCEGQQYDMEFEGLESVPMEDYIRMVGLKTAVLIACSAKMGALTAGRDEASAEAFYRFGYDLGLAFQIADDWLDTYGDVQVFGKTVGGDILNNKKTWLLTKAMEMADGGTKTRLQEAMGLPIRSAGQKAAKIAAVKAVYDGLGVSERACQEMARYHHRALGQLDALPLNALQKEMLSRYAAQLLGRKK